MRITAKRLWVLAGAAVAVAAISQIVLTTRLSISGPKSITQNTCTSEGYTITAKKVLKRVKNSNTSDISLSAKDANNGVMPVAFYADDSCTQQITSIGITDGNTSEPFYLLNPNEHDFSIIASMKGAPNASLAVKTIPQATTQPPVGTNPPHGQSGTIFGVLVNASDNKTPSISQKIQVQQALGAQYSRMQYNVLSAEVPAAGVDQNIAAGFKVIPSFRNMKNGQQDSSPVTDINAYKASISKYISYYKPELVVVENEENNKAFIPNTSVDQYIAELQATVDVAHQYGTKVANGGIDYPGAALATWNHYWTTGQYAAADAYAAKAFVGKLAQAPLDLPSQANPNQAIFGRSTSTKALLDRTLALIAAYKTMNFDYMNFHWYQATGGAMTETANYLRAATGKPVMNNELGQWDTSPETVAALLKEAQTANLAYAIWYSGDGSNAIALQNGDLSLRPTGDAFKLYVESTAR